MKESQVTEEKEACPVCGMTADEWKGAGYRKGGTEYCCEGCATGTGCTCGE